MILEDKSNRFQLKNTGFFAGEPLFGWIQTKRKVLLPIVIFIKNKIPPKSLWRDTAQWPNFLSC